MSAPAFTASTAADVIRRPAVIAGAVTSSAIAAPVNPSSPRNRSVVNVRDSDAVYAVIDALSPGTRPEAFTELLVARLLGRSLAHELGHVLLNSRSHEDAGLMRARYRDRDVLSIPTSAYTLNAVERGRLFARMAGEPHLASR